MNNLLQNIIKSARVSFILSLIGIAISILLFFAINHVFPLLSDIILGFFALFVVTFILNTVFDVAEYIFRSKE